MREIPHEFIIIEDARALAKFCGRREFPTYLDSEGLPIYYADYIPLRWRTP